MSLHERRLSADEIRALKFAAHRQLARWAKKTRLETRVAAQRAHLVSAVRTLEDREIARGCELRPPDPETTKAPA